MLHKIAFNFVVTLSILASSVLHADEVQIFGFADWATGSDLVLLSSETGAGTLIAENLAPRLGGASQSADGTIFLRDDTTLFQLNGSQDGLITIGEGISQTFEGGLAFQPGTDNLYGIGRNTISDENQLFLVDPNNGSTTLVGSNSDFLLDLNGLAFAPDGRLYTIASDTFIGDEYRLFEVDPTNGLLTELGGLGIGTSGTAGFDISDDGTGYFVEDSGLYRIDLTSATATFIGETGFSDFGSLVVVSKVPEPSSAFFLAFGLLVAGAKRRRTC